MSESLNGNVNAVESKNSTNVTVNGNGNVIWEAAVAVVSPVTDSATRSQASAVLQRWMETVDAWKGSIEWLRHSIVVAKNESNATAVQLLCLQLLQSKIRRELDYDGTGKNADQFMAAADQTLTDLGRILSEQSLQLQPPVISSACVCVAALCVRVKGRMMDLISSLSATIKEGTVNLQSSTSDVHQRHLLSALKVFAHIPSELQTCSLATPEVTQALWPHLQMSLQTLYLVIKQQIESLVNGASQPNNIQPNEHNQTAVLELALEALSSWTKVCHVTLTVLNTPISSSNDAILPLLVTLLTTIPSSKSVTERILVLASQILTEATLVPTDNCTDERAQAAHCLLGSTAQAIMQHSSASDVGQLSRDILSRHFLNISIEFASSQHWDDACHALATLATTLVCEHIDDIVIIDAQTLPILHLLLHLQVHPHYRLRMLVLDVWLTVQDIPASDRHDSWKAPLFTHVLTTLLQANAYPDFSDEACITDEEEVVEFRSMLNDVWISIYFLLRSEALQLIMNLCMSSDNWRLQESGLQAMSIMGKDVHSRLTKTRLKFAEQDREQTKQLLLHLLTLLMSHQTNSTTPTMTVDPITAAHGILGKDPLMLKVVITWIGAFAGSWDMLLNGQQIVQLIFFCQEAIRMCCAPSGMLCTAPDGLRTDISISAAKTLRSILIACSSSLSTNHGTNGGASFPKENLVPLLQHLLESSLRTENDSVATLVAEGCTRVVVQDAELLSRYKGLLEIVQPVFSCGQRSLELVQAATVISTVDGLPTIQEPGIGAVGALGRCLRTLQVVIRFCDGEGAGLSLRAVLGQLWPFLEQTTSGPAVQSECILDGIVAVHEQLLSTTPQLIATTFQQSLQYIVDLFEKSRRPCTLEYMARAVEVCGAEHLRSFQELLAHVSLIVFSQLSSGETADEHSDLARAFFELNQRFVLYAPAALLECSAFPDIVACAVEFTSVCSERDSARATLIFLSQLFGWQSLRLSPECQRQFESGSGPVEDLLVRYGAKIVQICLTTLMGGSQMLWPPCTECIFVIISKACLWPVNESPTVSVGRQWMDMMEPQSGDTQVYQQVVNLFLGFASGGPQNKPKARMILTDYTKICKGEMSREVLDTYRFA